METGGCVVSGVLLPNQETSFTVHGRKLSSRRLDRDGRLEGYLLDQNQYEIYETTLQQDSKCTCHITKRPILNLATWILLGWSYRLHYWGHTFGCCSGNFSFSWNLAKISGNLHEDLRTFMIKFRWILPGMRRISGKICGESEKKYFMLNTFYIRTPFLSWDNYDKHYKKIKGRVWGFFGTAACRPIVPLPPMRSPYSSPEAPRTT